MLHRMARLIQSIRSGDKKFALLNDVAQINPRAEPMLRCALIKQTDSHPRLSSFFLKSTNYMPVTARECSRMYTGLTGLISYVYSHTWTRNGQTGS
jgi:hypothetical protein